MKQLFVACSMYIVPESVKTISNYQANNTTSLSRQPSQTRREVAEDRLFLFQDKDIIPNCSIKLFREEMYYNYQKQIQRIIINYTEFNLYEYAL